MKIFLSRNGGAVGPYEEQELREMLKHSEARLDELAAIEGGSDWKTIAELLGIQLPPPPSNFADKTADIADQARAGVDTLSRKIDQKLSNLNSAIAGFLGEEQDPAVVQKLVEKATELLTSEETIEYIAVQKRPIINLAPDGILLTNRRFMIVRPKLLGMTFQDHVWRDIKNVHMFEQMLTATITCTAMSGTFMRVDSIPKKQARKIYAIAQEKEERVREERRMREMEERRAGAGGVTIASAPLGQQLVAPAPDDPLLVLGKLKSMLEAGLIDAQEYDTKKAEILSRM